MKIDKDTSQNKQSLTNQSIWILFAKMIGFGSNIVLPLLIVRYLVKDEVGTFRQFSLLVGNAISLLPLGLSMSAYYFLNRDYEERSAAVFNILLFNFVVGSLALLICLVYPDLLGNLFQNERISLLAPLIGLVVWLGICGAFFEIVALANQEARLASYFIISSQLIKTLLMAIAVIFYASVEALIYAIIAHSIFQVGILLAYLFKRFPYFWKSFDWKVLRKQFNYALPFGFAALLYTGQWVVHYYFVSYSFSPAEFAVFSQAAFHMPLIPVISESVSAVMIPRMNQLQGEGKKHEMLVMAADATWKLSLVYLPLFVFMMIASFEIITTLFTSDYADSVPIFRMNLLLLPVFCLPVDSIARAFHELGGFLLKLRLVLFSALFATLWFGTGYFGMLGILSVVIVVILLEAIASVWKSLKILDANQSDIYLVNNVWKTASAAALSGALFLVFYMLLKEWLTFITTDLISNLWLLLRIEKGVDFVAGCVFLGLCLIVYAPIYLFFVYQFGALDKGDKERILSFLQKITRGRRGKIIADLPIKKKI